MADVCNWNVDNWKCRLENTWFIKFLQSDSKLKIKKSIYKSTGGFLL